VQGHWSGCGNFTRPIRAVQSSPVHVRVWKNNEASVRFTMPMQWSAGRSFSARPPANFALMSRSATREPPTETQPCCRTAPAIQLSSGWPRCQPENNIAQENPMHRCPAVVP
jgi:hypothetical protein